MLVTSFIKKMEVPFGPIEFCNQCRYRNPQCKKILQVASVSHLELHKFRLSLPLLIIWFLWRIVVTIGGYFVHPIMFSGNVHDPKNITGHCNKVYMANLPVSISIVVYAALVILLDVFEWVQYIRRDHMFLHEAVLLKDYATQHGNYR